MTQPRRSLDVGLIGALADLLLAGILGAFLSVATDLTGDAVPRPIVLAVLYGTPGIIGLIGVRARRPWLLVAAALPLVPASLLSYYVTLVFVVPAALMLVGASDMRREPGGQGSGAGETVAAFAVAALVVLAVWAAVIGLTEPGCVAIAGGQTCGSAFVSVRGVFVAAACLVSAVAIALWRASRVRRVAAPVGSEVGGGGR
jgi:hypothetical protein